MADVLMIAIMIGFILVCVAYVGWCDRIIGSDADLDAAPAADEATGEPAEREAVSA